MSRFLFAMVEAGGNVPPQLGIVRRLVAWGHAVTVLGDRVLEAGIEQAGGAYAAYRPCEGAQINVNQQVGESSAYGTSCPSTASRHHRPARDASKAAAPGACASLRHTSGYRAKNERFPAGLELAYMQGMKKLSVALVSLAALAGPMFAPSSADACGGMFCDGGGPVTMRVDQTGENILYAIGNGQVEAHIQIQYTGSAARFAWVLPVLKSPSGTPISIGIGSQRLFDALLLPTVPTYSYTTQNNCQAPSKSGSGGSAGTSAAGQSGKSGASGGGGPTVVQKGVAGAFDYVVLDVPPGGTAAELMGWLQTNGYSQVPEAEALFTDYISKNYQFVAIRLTGGAGIEEIHPLVVKYDGDTPCVPIKLTQVAAKENMGVRTFFLGTGRWVPTNYRHVTLNEARINWLTLGNSYRDLVNAAVDAPVADGHAFITEYAGGSQGVQTASVFPPQWSADPFTTTMPKDVVGLLMKQGLATCNGVDTCTFAHPLVASVLHDFLPTPLDVKDGAFYNCFGCYASSFDMAKWSAPDFAKALLERVIVPSKHAADLVKQNPYLTRLYTTLSPAEMTEDPEFHLRADLPPVQSFHTATRQIECGATGMQISSSRSIGLSSGVWPNWPAEMPSAETVEDIPKTGFVVQLVNNTEKIDALIAAWNTAHGWPPSAGGPGGSSSAAGQGGAPSSADAAATTPDEAEGGCSVGDASRSAWPLWSSLGMLGVAAALRRRWRRA